MSELSQKDESFLMMIDAAMQMAIRMATGVLMAGKKVKTINDIKTIIQMSKPITDDLIKKYISPEGLQILIDRHAAKDEFERCAELQKLIKDKTEAK